MPSAVSDVPSVSLSFANNFWGKDDAGVEPLLQRMHNAKQTCDELKSFYTARASLEEDYARKLMSLARKPLGSQESGTLRAALDVLRGEVEQMGKSHQNNAAQMKTELEEPLAAFAGAMKERRKIVQGGIEKLLKIKTQQTQHVNKTRDKYEQECLKIKGYLAQGHMVMGQEERKNKAKLEKTQINLATSNTEYENAVKALEETTGRWNRDWKAAADKFQDLEEERLDFTKASLWSFANIASTVCVSDDASCEKVRLSLENCEVEKDIVSFIKDRGTGQEIPDPPKYINFCRGDVDTQSEASEDDNYSVAQFQRTINPAYRSSSPQPSTYESHHDPQSALVRDLVHEPAKPQSRETTVTPQKPQVKKSRQAQVEDYEPPQPSRQPRVEDYEPPTPKQPRVEARANEYKPSPQRQQPQLDYYAQPSRKQLEYQPPASRRSSQPPQLQPHPQLQLQPQPQREREREHQVISHSQQHEHQAISQAPQRDYKIQSQQREHQNISQLPPREYQPVSQIEQRGLQNVSEPPKREYQTASQPSQREYQPASQLEQRQQQAISQPPQREYQPVSQLEQRLQQVISQPPQREYQPIPQLEQRQQQAISQPPKREYQPVSQLEQRQQQTISQPPKREYQAASQPPQRDYQPVSPLEQRQEQAISQPPKREYQPIPQLEQRQQQAISQAPKREYQAASQPPQRDHQTISKPQQREYQTVSKPQPLRKQLDYQSQPPKQPQIDFKPQSSKPQVEHKSLSLRQPNTGRQPQQDPPSRLSYEKSEHGPLATVPHDPHPLEGMTMFCRTGPPSERSSAHSPVRPTSRDSQSEYSNPTSLSSQEPPSGKTSPVKEVAPPPEKQVTKKKSAFFNSPFRRKSTKEKEHPAIVTPASRNTWSARSTTHTQQASPTKKPQTYSQPLQNMITDRPSGSPEPVDPRASFQLNVGNNVFDVAAPEPAKKLGQKAAVPEEEPLDPIAQALAELKGATKASASRVSADKFHGVSTPAPGSTPSSRPVGSQMTNGALVAGTRGTPPPSYDQPIQRLGLPQPAFTSKAMQQTRQKYVDQTQNMFSPPAARPDSSGYTSGSASRPGTRGSDMPRAASPAPPRSVSPRPDMRVESRQSYRAPSPNPIPYSGSQRSRAPSIAPQKRTPTQSYSHRNSPSDFHRAASPAPFRDQDRPSSSHVESDMSMQIQLAPAPDEWSGSQSGRGSRAGGSTNSRAMSFYGGYEEQQITARSRSKSVADIRQYNREGRPILHFARALYMYQAAIPEELSFAKGDVLAVLRLQDDGWWEAEVAGKNGRPGLVPSNYLQNC